MRFLFESLAYGLIIFIMFGFFSKYVQAAEGIDCAKHPLYCATVKLQPSVDKKWAFKFSNLLYKHAKKYGMDPYRSLAIAMQESSLRPINRTTTMVVMLKQRVCYNVGACVDIDGWQYITGATDVGVFQFSARTLRDYGINVARMQNDLEYVVEEHFKFLKQKIRTCVKKKISPAWACYHSKTPKRHAEYKELVNRFYLGKK